MGCAHVSSERYLSDSISRYKCQHLVVFEIKLGLLNLNSMLLRTQYFAASWCLERLLLNKLGAWNICYASFWYLSLLSWAFVFTNSDIFNVKLNAAAGTSADRPRTFKKVCNHPFFSTLLYWCSIDQLLPLFLLFSLLLWTCNRIYFWVSNWIA